MEPLDQVQTHSIRVMMRALEQWDKTQGPMFQIRESDLAWNLTGQNLVTYSEQLIAGIPCIVGVSSEIGIQSGLSPSSIWLSVWGDIPAGQERNFASEFIKLGKSLDKTKFVFGADEFQFVPGIPVGNPRNERLKNALLELGFEGSNVFDLIGPANSAEVKTYIDSGLALAKEKGWKFRFLPMDKSSDSHQSLARFLADEFPGRWQREFALFRSKEDTDRAVWAELVESAVDGGTDRVIGFARFCIRGRLLPTNFGWTPGALRLPLRPANIYFPQEDDGCLGPIGVASSQRGQGTGKALLAFVLNALQSRGARSICIDWTDALKYYEPLNYKIERQYWTARKICAN